jgi:hypothetical protein
MKLYSAEFGKKLPSNEKIFITREDEFDSAMLFALSIASKIVFTCANFTRPFFGAKST